MPTTRKNHPPSLKAKVAVEAIQGHKTTTQIAQKFGVHPTQVGSWKNQAVAGLGWRCSATGTTASCNKSRPRRASSTNRSAN